MARPEFDYEKHLEVYQHPKSLFLTLPISPTINAAYRGLPNGGLAAKPALTDYKNKIGKLLAGRVMRLDDPASPYAFHNSFLLEADVCFCMMSGDVDNRIKPLFDALEFADVFENDKLIQRLIGAEATTPAKDVPEHVNITLTISRDKKRRVIYPWWEGE